MKRVRIVGGGLTGILAAFQAHRLGATHIELHERYDQLGGIALPHRCGGREVREGCIYFGPADDPIRSLLELHGASFEDFDNRFGSVSPGHSGPVFAHDFGGPMLDSTSMAVTRQGGDSLAHRLACYDAAVSTPLARYVRWHVGSEPAQLHASAAIPLAINRVFPAGISVGALAGAKRTDPLADELFGIPRSLWGYSGNAKASLPRGGFTQLFAQCRKALEAIGVIVHDRSLATPGKLLHDPSPCEVLVWAASPMPLFKAVGLATPKAPARRYATYTFEVSWTGPAPFYVQNFSAEGSCFRVYLYRSEGAVLLAAECVEECSEDRLRVEIAALLSGFAGRLDMGALIHTAIKPRWLYHSVDTIKALDDLSAALSARMRGNFVSGAWPIYAKGEKFAAVDRDLRNALCVHELRAAS